MTTMIEVPKRSASRDEADRLLESLPDNLTGYVVRLSFDETEAASPSFIDQLVKMVLEDRSAAKLEIVRPLDRNALQAESSAARRGVSDRLSVIDVRSWSR